MTWEVAFAQVTPLNVKWPELSVVAVARTVLVLFPLVPASTNVTVEPEIGFLPPSTWTLIAAVGPPGVGVGVGVGVGGEVIGFIVTLPQPASAEAIANRAADAAEQATKDLIGRVSTRSPP
jgi:hypothetical protein